MTLNTQQGGKGPVHRRASTPVPLSHRSRPGIREPRPNPIESRHPPLGGSSSFEPGDKAPVAPCSSWSSDSADSDSSWESLYRVVLLGDPGVGKTSLASLFAGIQERDLPEQPGEDAYERTLSVDGEETTLLVMDTWETERRMGRPHLHPVLKMQTYHGFVERQRDILSCYLWPAVFRCPPAHETRLQGQTLLLDLTSARTHCSLLGSFSCHCVTSPADCACCFCGSAAGSGSGSAASKGRRVTSRVNS